MRREIVINGRFLSRRVTGVERSAREITKALANRCRIETTTLNGVSGHAWEQFILPQKLNENSILWSPANTGPTFVRNQALTIHDLSPLEHPEWYKPAFSAWYRFFLPILAKRARVVFAPSEFVKSKVMARFGIKNLVVTPNGVDTAFFHPAAKQTTFDLPKKYILFVGSIQPRKNLDGLMRAWQKIKDEFQTTWLVVAGTSGSVFRLVKVFDGERIRFLNYVPEYQLPALYANAQLFVLPSYDEGFGLPALEAMACGTPVIVSDGGALPEVVGDAGIIFRLDEPEALSQMMKECLNSKALRGSLIERGLKRAKTYSWQNSAEIIWSTLNDL